MAQPNVRITDHAVEVLVTAPSTPATAVGAAVTTHYIELLTTTEPNVRITSHDTEILVQQSPVVRITDHNTELLVPVTPFPGGSGLAQAFIAPTDPYTRTVLSQGPLAYWPLDDPSGSTAFKNLLRGPTASTSFASFEIAHDIPEKSGNKSISWSTGGTPSGFVDFAGAIPETSGSFVTVTGWIKLNPSNTQMMFGWFVYDVVYVPGSNYFGFNSGGGDNYGFVFPTALLNQWVHIAVVYKDNESFNVGGHKIYLNGVQQTLTQQLGSSGTPQFQQIFVLSGWQINGSESARGTGMDEIALFTSELTADQIKAQYNVGRIAGYGQAQAWISGTTLGQGQAQAQITTPVGYKFGQVQASIFIYPKVRITKHETELLVTVNPNVLITTHLTEILIPFEAPLQQGYGQAQAVISGLRHRVGQAQAKMLAFGQAQTGLALARIKQINRVHGQASAYIGNFKSGQAQARIIQVYSGHGQALGFVLPRQGYAQAQAKINAFNVPRHGQTQAQIKQVYRVSGQARTLIVGLYGHGQARARIIRFFRARGQARAYIGHFQSGQAQAYISKTKYHGQAQATIKQVYRNSGQAQALIQRFEKGGQAQGTIKQIYTYSGQAQALLDTGFGLGHAQAWIKVTDIEKIGQVQARIKQTYNQTAQAQAVMKYRYRSSGQAQAWISLRRIGSGQAQAFIGSYKFGQAQAKINAFDYPQHGLAMAYILYNPNIPTTGPTSQNYTYLVRYNDHTLEGYAQNESIQSIARIEPRPSAYVDASLSDYLGLQNHKIVLNMRLWESTYFELKQKMQRAATSLRSSKGFAKLYIQKSNRHYIALVKSIRTEKSVGTSVRLLDYEVEFETKPWAISNNLYEISGTGIINTDQVNRSYIDGGWTPVRMILTGNDITVSGYTQTGAFTGFVSVSGAVSNLIIDSEELTAYDNDVSRNYGMNYLDYSVYVGPGKTYFAISGASACVIQWYNRWYL